MSNVEIKILILDMIKILGNIHDRSLAIVFGTVFFFFFLKIVETCFLMANISQFSYIFCFYPKKAEVLLEKLP